MSFIIDTCVFSELSKPRPHQGVADWFDSCPADLIYISSITLGEIQYGIDLLPEGKKKNDLRLWFEKLIDIYRDYTLPITGRICRRLGEERARLIKKGRKAPVIDCLIACTSIEHDFTLATRNISDFKMYDIKTLNPWEYD